MAPLGVGWRGGFYPHKVYLLNGASGIFPFVVFFCFTRCIIQHISLSEKYRGLRYIIEGYYLIVCVRHFGGGSEVVSEIDDRFHAICLVCSVRPYQRSPLLLPGFCICTLLFGGGLVGLLSLGYIRKRGSEIHGGTALKL